MLSEHSLNESACQKVLEIIKYQDTLHCKISTQKNGTTIIDAGIHVTGSMELGRLLGEICMGGLGAVKITQLNLEGWDLPGVVVGTKAPTLATLGSQFAGWSLKLDGYFAMASGPARALVGSETIFSKIDYHDSADRGVILLETRELPSETVTEYIAEKCGIAPSNLFCIIAPTASLAGSVQIAARIVEVGVHKFHELDFDIDKIRIGHGVAPIAPVAKKDSHAMGQTNDCILYGGRTYFQVRLDDTDDMESLIPQVPASSSDQYGRPFYDLFKSFQFDFYKIDPLLFSPAEVTVTDIESGRVYKAGHLDLAVLQESFGV